MNQASFSASKSHGKRIAPMLKGAPVLAHTIEMARDPLQLFVRGYKELGPVFRVRAANRVFTVIAGPEAFEFIAKGGEVNLSISETLGGPVQEVGAKRSLVTLEQEDHAHMRKAMRSGYSKSMFIDHAKEAFAQTASQLQNISSGAVLNPFSLMQRLVMEQLALALLGEEANADFEAVRTYITTSLNVHVQFAPKLMLKLPAYQRAKRRFMDMGDRIVGRRISGEAGARGDLLDDGLAYSFPDGDKLTRRELAVLASGPFIAGMDTAAAMATFLLYELTRHPQIKAAIQREADAHFDLKTFSPEMIMRMPTLHAAAMETLRMHTIALAQPRIASRDFEFNGYSIKQGESIMLSSAVSHFLPQFYPQPYRFDLDRAHAPRNEYRQKHAYAPYGIGAHLCLGSGVAEMQFPLNVALLLKIFDVEMAPANYTLRQVNNPTPHPVGFKVKLIRR